MLADWEGSGWAGGSDAAEGEVAQAELVSEGIVGQVEVAETACGGFCVEGCTEAVCKDACLERVERCFDGARGEEEREQVVWPARVECMQGNAAEDVGDEAFEGRAVVHGGGCVGSETIAGRICRGRGEEEDQEDGLRVLIPAFVHSKSPSRHSPLGVRHLTPS